MKKIKILFVSIILLSLLSGCNSADTYDIKSTNIEEARIKAKSFNEFKTEMENIGFNIETKNAYALNGSTNHRLEFNLSILQMAEYKYIHFEFPDEAIEESLNIESVVATDHTDSTLIGVTKSKGVEMQYEGGIWKVSYKEGLDDYWFGFYINPRNKQLQSNGELILSHGDYHWRGSY